MREKILNLLESEGELPPLPDIVIRLREMIQTLDTTIHDIVKLIEMDPVLALNIIKLSNSVYYSRSTTKINTLPLAITRIGLDMLVKFVFSLKLCPLFSESTFLSNSQFWLHSLAVAIFSHSLCYRIKATKEEQDITYLSGLMHDVGIMAFGYLIPLEYDEFIKKNQGIKEPLELLEQNAFGIDHSELGSLYIDRWWQVDENITHAVKYHHISLNDLKNKRNFIQLVHIANSICNNHGITNGINGYTDDFKKDILVDLGLSNDEIENILEDVNSSLDQAKELVAHGFSK